MHFSKLLLCRLFLTAVVFCSCVVASASDGRQKLLILPFSVPQEFAGTQLGRVLSESIAQELLSAGGLRIVSKDELDLVIRKTSIDPYSPMSKSQLRRLAAELGAEYVVQGQVTEFTIRKKKTILGEVSEGLGGTNHYNTHAYVTMDLRLLDGKNAELLAKRAASGSDGTSKLQIPPDEMRLMVISGETASRKWKESQIGVASDKAVKDAVIGILEMFPVWAKVESRVKTGDTEVLILDRGREDGLKPGMELEVYRETPISNPGGKPVWPERELIGRIEITQTDRMSGKARIVSEQTRINPGDMVSFTREVMKQTSTEQQGKNP